MQLELVRNIGFFALCLTIFSVGCDNKKPEKILTDDGFKIQKEDSSETIKADQTAPSVPTEVKITSKDSEKSDSKICLFEATWKASIDNVTHSTDLTYILYLSDSQEKAPIANLEKVGTEGKETHQTLSFSADKKFPLFLFVRAKNKAGNWSELSDPARIDGCKKSSSDRSENQQNPIDYRVIPPIPPNAKIRIEDENSGTAPPVENEEIRVAPSTLSDNQNEFVPQYFTTPDVVMIPATDEELRNLQTSYSPLVDQNQHDDHFPQESMEDSNADHTGTLYIRSPNQIFYVTRWNQNSNGPTVNFSLTLTEGALSRFHQWIKPSIQHLNKVAKETKITQEGQDFIALSSVYTTKSREDLQTHTIEVDEGITAVNQGSGITYLKFDPHTGQIINADIVIFQKFYDAILAPAYKKELQYQSNYQNGYERWFKKTVTHHILHALGLADNYLGNDRKIDYRSITDPKVGPDHLLYAIKSAYPSTSSQFNSARDYDRNHLKFLYATGHATLPNVFLLRTRDYSGDFKIKIDRHSVNFECIQNVDSNVVEFLIKKGKPIGSNTTWPLLEWDVAISRGENTFEFIHKLPQTPTILKYPEKTPIAIHSDESFYVDQKLENGQTTDEWLILSGIFYENRSAFGQYRHKSKVLNQPNYKSCVAEGTFKMTPIESQ